MTRDVIERILNLDIGEKTLVHLPDCEVTHYWVRRTEDGYEATWTLSEWRSVSPSDLRAAVAGGVRPDV